MNGLKQVEKTIEQTRETMPLRPKTITAALSLKNLQPLLLGGYGVTVSVYNKYKI